jgi:hypothetical protein
MRGWRGRVSEERINVLSQTMLTCRILANVEEGCHEPIVSPNKAIPDGQAQKEGQGSVNPQPAL